SKIYDGAEKQFANALLIGTHLQVDYNQPKPRVLMPGNGTPTPIMLIDNQEQNAEPEWRTFFGSIDQCECDHCQSAISPAAYLVDILNFLESTKKTDSKEVGAFKTLKIRRPDIFNTALTCK